VRREVRVSFVERTPESFLTIFLQETWERGIKETRRSGGFAASFKMDEIVHQWEQMLKDCKSNSCMWVIRIPRQIKVPV